MEEKDHKAFVRWMREQEKNKGKHKKENKS